MAKYDYKGGKKRIIEILHSKTKILVKDTIPVTESEFTYENGIKTWVGALFVDIKNSTDMFSNGNKENLARVMRAFCKEIITILSANSNYRQIGIRGDCVYAIYSTPSREDIRSVLDDAIMISTFQEMLQKILKENQFDTFDIGIGLGASETLIIKAGYKGSGVSDNIWIGDSVVDASKLSSQGNRDSFSTIVMDDTFFSKIKDLKPNSSNTFFKYFSQKYSQKLGKSVYHGDMIYTDFNDWVNGGMKDE